MPDNFQRLPAGNVEYEIHQETLEACVTALDSWLDSTDDIDLTRENLEAPVLAVLLAALVSEQSRIRRLTQDRAAEEVLRIARDGSASQAARYWPRLQPIRQEFGTYQPTIRAGMDLEEGDHLHFQVMPEAYVDRTPTPDGCVGDWHRVPCSCPRPQP